MSNLFVFKIGDIIENKINNTFAKIYSIDNNIVVLMCYDNVFSIFRYRILVARKYFVLKGWF